MLKRPFDLDYFLPYARGNFIDLRVDQNDGEIDYGSGIPVDSFETVQIQTNPGGLPLDRVLHTADYIYNMLIIAEFEDTVTFPTQRIDFGDGPGARYGPEDKRAKVFIFDNPLLTECTSDFWCHMVSTLSADEVYIENNGPGCSYDEIVSACRVSSSEASIYDGDKIAVYPNPALDYVVWSEPCDQCWYEIVSAAGRIVSSGWLAQQQVGVSDLSTGMYMLRVIDGELVSHGRFVKESWTTGLIHV